MSTPVRFSVAVRPPFSLPATVAILRRHESNAVDHFTADGRFIRNLVLADVPEIIEVSQTADDMLSVRTLHNDRAGVRAIVRRMLGLDVDMSLFAKRAARIPWLRATARAMEGVRPPRYPSLWEACVNAIVFQQISIIAASAMLRRAIERLSPPRAFMGGEAYPFFSPQAVLTQPAAALTDAGWSTAKAAGVRRVAEAFTDGALDETTLAALDSPAAAAYLQAIKGIGPWTAAVVLLRGLGRLDVFPEGDSGAARSLKLIEPGLGAKDVAHARKALGDREGMLYYALLYSRLAARGALPPGATRCGS